MRPLPASVHPTIKQLFWGRPLLMYGVGGSEMAMKPAIKQYLDLDTRVHTNELAVPYQKQNRINPLAALRKRTVHAMQQDNLTLGISHEACFKPHPQLPFLYVHEESVIFIDLENDLEVTERIISTGTVYAKKEITHINDLTDFAEQVGFPFQGIVLKPVKHNHAGEQPHASADPEFLFGRCQYLLSQNVALVAETEARGFLNPSRMKVLERCTTRLMKKLMQLCPSCLSNDFLRHVNEAAEQHRPALTTYRCTTCGYRQERYSTTSH
jgi:DNA-directed RNA polymerase subunit M/transcription elongation factor TFIIS